MLTTRVLVAVAPLMTALCLGGACNRSSAPLGPADSYLIFEVDPKSPPTGGAAALPLLREVALDDPRALPVHRAALDGFVGEILRTDYLVKQLISDEKEGRIFSREARLSAAEPTILVLAGSRIARADEASISAGFQVARSFGRIESHPDILAIDVGDDPVSDPAFVQTAAGRIARLVVERLVRATDGAATPPGPAPSRVLIDGYALAMEVIGREWRVGEGPRGVLPPEAGTGTQRERFAATRQNAFVFTPGDARTLRPAADMLTEPGVTAAVIYRMAQSTGVGRRVAPPEVYAPFVSARVPPGVSPAAVLGPIRNFQAKLLWAWAHAIRDGHAPRDVVDLVNAYAAALPAERAEVVRIFVVTTYGATMKAGGVSPLPADAEASFAELTALAAQASAGRRSLRDAIAAP